MTGGAATGRLNPRAIPRPECAKRGPSVATPWRITQADHSANHSGGRLARTTRANRSGRPTALADPRQRAPHRAGKTSAAMFGAPTPDAGPLPQDRKADARSKCRRSTAPQGQLAVPHIISAGAAEVSGCRGARPQWARGGQAGGPGPARSLAPRAEMPAIRPPDTGRAPDAGGADRHDRRAGRARPRGRAPVKGRWRKGVGERELENENCRRTARAAGRGKNCPVCRGSGHPYHGHKPDAKRRFRSSDFCTRLLLDRRSDRQNGTDI